MSERQVEVTLETWVNEVLRESDLPPFLDYDEEVDGMMEGLRGDILKYKYEKEDMPVFEERLQAWNQEWGQLQKSKDFIVKSERWQVEMNERYRVWRRREEERGRIWSKVKNFLGVGVEEKEDIYEDMDLLVNKIHNPEAAPGEWRWPYPRSLLDAAPKKHRKTRQKYGLNSSNVFQDGWEGMEKVDRLRERRPYKPLEPKVRGGKEWIGKANEVREVLDAKLGSWIEHVSEDRHYGHLKAVRDIQNVSDLTTPASWYPYSRLEERTVVYHGGPTNSGKTYEALKRLRKAATGMYLGPLRLLALEVYEDLTASGVYTDLLTGQEKRSVPFSTHVSATVEMCPLNKEYDVVVIDEIQMIGDGHRGHAWGRALMGARAKEIHVCGGGEGRDLVREICRETGDRFVDVEYERLEGARSEATSWLCLHQERQTGGAKR